jgi:hypothetical protein
MSVLAALVLVAGAPTIAGSRRSSHWIEMSPRRKSSFSITRRWKSRDVSTPSIVSSSSARRIRAIACSRVRPWTISFASIGS